MRPRHVRWILFASLIASILVTIATDAASDVVADRERESQEGQINAVVSMMLDVLRGNMTNESAQRFVDEFRSARHFNDGDAEILGVLHNVGLGVMAISTVFQFAMIRVENLEEL